MKLHDAKTAQEVELCFETRGNINKLRGYQKETALLVASREGNAEVVQSLLQHGADPTIPDRSNSSPLLHACSNGHTSVVSLLLEDERVDINDINDVVGDFCPLAAAGAGGHVDVVELLIRSQRRRQPLQL